MGDKNRPIQSGVMCTNGKAKDHKINIETRSLLTKGYPSVLENKIYFVQL